MMSQIVRHTILREVRSMVKVNRLKAKIVELEMSVESVAERIGMDKSTLYRRFQNPDDFTLGEIGALSDTLGMGCAEAQSIFFGA